MYVETDKVKRKWRGAGGGRSTGRWGQKTSASCALGSGQTPPDVSWVRVHLIEVRLEMRQDLLKGGQFYPAGIGNDPRVEQGRGITFLCHLEPHCSMRGLGPHFGITRTLVRNADPQPRTRSVESKPAFE